MRTREQRLNERMDEINASTGFANGERFESDAQVRSYFTVEAMEQMMGYWLEDFAGDLTSDDVGRPLRDWAQERLNVMANAVIEGRIWMVGGYPYEVQG